MGAVMLVTAGAGCNAEDNNAQPPVDTTIQLDFPSGITIPDARTEQLELPDNAALKFVEDMKIGWSLGNTLDATTNSKTDELSVEKSWCGYYTTEQMVLDVKNAGFNTIRVPVTWHNHVDKDFNISKVWLDRVQEVVDYGYKNGMYVILDIHHDSDKKYIYPDNEHYESSEKYIKKIWEQLSERFKDYDEKLIFETQNEPRLIGTPSEWWIQDGSDIAKETIGCINKLNQAAVDTIRASGGNNAERYIMVPSYCASYSYAVSELFVMPKDTADNKIIVSVHAYTPYNFALQAPTDKGSSNKFVIGAKPCCGEIDTLFAELYKKFTSKGVPVVIGEFGARNKSDNLEARVNFSAYYIAKARSVGISCCWWDNNAFYGNGELFGIYDRSTNTWPFPEIVSALMLNVK